MRISIIFFLVSVLFLSCNKEETGKAPLFNNLGTLHFPVTTSSELAQKYFDQGVILAYGFNHEEAFRSFEEVARLDSNCAMAYWGMAYVLGPNINLPMDAGVVHTAHEAIQKAISLLDNETQKEKDFVMALSERYSAEVLEDRTPLDQAYSDAMRNLSSKYPDDLDAATMFAESIMDCHPWDYWLKDGTAQPWTPELLAVLESVIERNPDHHGANHLYIHAVEASKKPHRGLSSADKLRFLAPGAGHLVHMPAHIYIRTGKYHEGSLANIRAVKSDEEYINQCNQQGFYPISYYPHNYHFLWATATLEGDSKTAIDAALKTSQKPPDSLMEVCGYQTLQHFATIPLYAYVTFGKWDEILDYPQPQDERPYMQAVWHYARAMAFIAKDEIDKASDEITKLSPLTNNKSIEELSIWGINSAGLLVKIAYEVTNGELEAKKKNYEKAISHLTKAVEYESQLRYDEPPTWFYPCRQNLGAVLLEAGKYAEAEKVYKENLEEIPDNGWGLFGLQQALLKQGKSDEAVEVEKRFNEAWKHADIKLISSRVM
ncbi:MAG: tetratricopeptide repeat protein [bacterium]|nr:tetratricopeptide repeat protein [bacterium]